MYKQRQWKGVVHATNHSIWMPKAERRIKDSGSAWNTVAFRPALTTHCKPLLETGRERRNTLTSMLGDDFTRVFRFHSL